MHEKQRYLYIGVDTHKETHTAVLMDCWNDILATKTFENKVSDFIKLLDVVKQHKESLIPIFGLEDVNGFGRRLAVFLIDNGYIVKSVNPALAKWFRDSAATTEKNDEYDAYSVACVLLSKLNNLPDADPQDLYWTLRQLTLRRDSLVKSRNTIINQLHNQLSNHYTKYNKFFCDIDGKTALEFWYEYPSPRLLKKVTLEELTLFLRKASHNACSTRKAGEILELVKEDEAINGEYQDARDCIVKSIVKDIKFKQGEIADIEKECEKILKLLGYKLESMAGIGTATAANLISEIGDINRFSSPDKLAKYAGIAPKKFSSAGKGKEQKNEQGNRKLHGIFYFLAIEQVQVSKGSKIPRNPVFYEYFNRKVKEGKTKPQALVCVMRRLVNIIYGMMKNKTEYVMPAIQEKEVV